MPLRFRSDPLAFVCTGNQQGWLCEYR
jgi:hypothetical protein